MNDAFKFNAGSQTLALNPIIVIVHDAICNDGSLFST